ncbi:fatty acyl-CoA reductase 1-like [Centruroides sculpturatus]|uniref:fatty acyl-CoA reductase 1-like n=1 Tax=Centruroides sculpturatus TaxID=218467 RepID=UPI000C6EB555|nr:fatty acyl-CoA reductase 1-like [Centruroides sculpturatus]
MDEMQKVSKIAAFYKEKYIFITGGTGFLGKVFGRMKEERPNYREKLHIISGDLSEPLLGISETDLDLLSSEVSIVYHVAATVRFDEALKIAVEQNLLGTKRLIEVCKRLRNLESLVHVSTAYCNCNRSEPDEIIYPSKVDPEELIRTIQWMDTDLVDTITPKLIDDFPNTYSFTKNLAEKLYLKETDLPVSIFRPTIVSPSWKEPYCVLVHLSTAFCNVHEKYLYEKIYPTRYSSKKILDCLQWMDDEAFESLRKNFLYRHPNNYTYSKCLAEQLLKEEGDGLPILIIRPSFILPAVKEPIEGWIDVWNSPVAVAIAFGMGFLRIIRAFMNNTYDVVPVDICASTTIASAWFYINQNCNELTVCHCTTSMLNPPKNSEIFNMTFKLVDKYPLCQAYRYPRIIVTENSFIYDIGKVFLHYLPAIFVDGGRVILGKKPMLVNLYKKVHLKMKQMDYFLDKEWKFDVSNYKKLLESLSKEDKQLFNCDVRSIEWLNYVEISVKNNRFFLMNEDEESLPRARKHLSRN